MAMIGDVTDQDFEQRVLGADKPVLVDFWAEWCVPCHMVSPVVEEIGRDKGESLQVAAPELIGADVPARDMYLRFEVVGGGGRVLAYGVAVDNASGDAIYVPAVRESEAALPH